MKTYKKVLFYKEAESPLAWRGDRKAKTKIEAIMWFDFKEGLRFSVGAGNITSCERNIFKAILRVLEHESIGMAKYDCLKEDTRSKGLWKKLQNKRGLRVNIHRDREALRHIKLQRKDMKQRTEIVQR